MKYLTKDNASRAILSVLTGYFVLAMFNGLVLIRTAKIFSSRLGVIWAGGLIFLLLLNLVIYTCVLYAVWRPEKLLQVRNIVVSIRKRLGVWRWLLAFLSLTVPIIFLLYVPSGALFKGIILRFLIAAPACLFIALFVTQDETELVKPISTIFALLLFVSIFILADHLTFVSNYPFSFTWSEGNRLYDYSVILGSSRYQYAGKLTIPYDNPGRYLLWGFIFAIADTPIWLHRLWDAVLSTAPYVLFGYLLARMSQLGRLAKINLAIWIFLFLYQGPIYAPLIISAMIVVMTVNKKRLWLSLLGVAIAGSYASLSRWTWMPAPAIWAVLLWVSDIKWQPGDGWRKAFRQLIPVAAVAITGLAAGFLSKAEFFSPEELASTTTFEQPLLLYRLLPNATFSSGILLALLAAAGPVIVLMIWGVVTRGWQINWLQGVIYLTSGLATLIVGLVISTKIGGGGDLHNLDMFLITLVVLTGLLFKGRSGISWKSWPFLGKTLFAMVILIPVFSVLSEGEPLRLPSAEQVEKGLDVIQREVDLAKAKGEVLFMDQRQLLTFGFIRNVPLVADYEKKFVMDMAMGNNKEYFDAFYSDLARKRFAMIVSEPLKVVEKGQVNSFGEENNAWVKWVSNPILCYYEPIKTWKSIKVQLLVPRSAPVKCP
jgi:hypothetical protein